MRAYNLIGFPRLMVRCFTIGVICTMIAACNVLEWGESLEQKGDKQAAEEGFGEGLDLGEPDTETGAEDDGELEFDLSGSAPDGSDLITGPSETCPTTSTTYNLWYDHTCVLSMSSHGEEFYFEETSDFYPFVFTIEADGRVVHDFEPYRIDENDDPDVYLDFKGYIKSDSGSCPITNYTGHYPIRAEITGQCENGMVFLHVKMEKIDVNIKGDCQLASGFTVSGLTSAPEIDHIFVHRQNGDAYILEVPPGGALAGVPGSINCTYLFLLRPPSPTAPDDLDLVPLPTSGQ
jgi:hypothetical protein